jgi:3-oxoacyl-[acyl-carrier-protein] synthase III
MEVYITRLSKFLPNSPVDSEEIEGILGMVGGKPSRTKRIILRNNGIKKRYYSLDKDGKITYSNAEMAAKAVKALADDKLSVADFDLLCCGTSIPDQILPSHTTMVHGLLGNKPMETASLAGGCCSGMHALKYAYMSVKSGNSQNAVCAGSELLSPIFQSHNFSSESRSEEEIQETPILGFEKDFLRWMLSDGAGAALLENQPRGEMSLRIDWIDAISYANEAETCMYAGGDKEGSELMSYKNYAPDAWLSQNIFAMKQDVKLLDKNIIKYGFQMLKQVFEKHKIDNTTIDHFLPHFSSEFFIKKMEEILIENGLAIPKEKWYTNLSRVGNIGSASIFIILEELFNSGKLKKGEKILLSIPESARFSYVYVHLTVV